ncbi:MAG TPA: serine hydrolase [Thermoanaerobaculia bacterium]|jgi:CubicO group peptidase (beta-lactamase class C family)
MFKRLAVLLLFAASLRAQLPPELDAYIESARKEADVPGMAVTVVRDGKVLVAKGYGVRRLGTTTPVDENTAWDVASLSKSFTSAMVATLVDDGTLRWDDPVRRYLPQVEFGEACRNSEVTLRDLLSHRTGLEPANTLFVVTGYDTDEMLRRIRYLKPRVPFRTEEIYSNVLFSAAGEAAAAAAHATWAELVTKRLLIPLEMHGASAGVKHDRGPNFASSHEILGGAQRVIDTGKFMAIHPAGGVNATAADMANYMLFQLGDGTWKGKRIVSAKELRETHTPQVLISTTPEMRAARNVRFFAAYGLGWNVMDYRGHPMIWHSGNANGMPVYMALLPEEKIGVFVAVNTWGAPFLHGAIASRILDTLLGETPSRDYAAEATAAYKRSAKSSEEQIRKEEAARAKESKPSRELAAYAGTYNDPLYGDIVIANGPKLTLQFARGEVADLEHWQYDTFRVHWRDAMMDEDFRTFVTFTLDTAGVPSRLRMRVNRDDVEAVRR